MSTYHRNNYIVNREKILEKGVSYREKQSADPEWISRENARIRKWRRDNPIRHLMSLAKARAKKKGMTFDLVEKDLLPYPDVCPVLGITLAYGGRGNSRDPNLASIDRIDNNTGYVKGNVVIVSLRANKLKNDATIEEIRCIVDFYEGFQNLVIRKTG